MPAAGVPVTLPLDKGVSGLWAVRCHQAKFPTLPKEGGVLSVPAVGLPVALPPEKGVSGLWAVDVTRPSFQHSQPKEEGVPAAGLPVTLPSEKGVSGTVL